MLPFAVFSKLNLIQCEDDLPPSTYEFVDISELGNVQVGNTCGTWPVDIQCFRSLMCLTDVLAIVGAVGELLSVETKFGKVSRASRRVKIGAGADWY